MNATFPLGRFRGIEIGANWSWLVIVTLLTWSLADGVFPHTNEGLAPATYYVMAVIAVPVFFACLLAHELGHALQARREGVQIDGITLWLFGGVARFSGRFPSAGAEFRIAIAGPAVSAALGAAFLGASLALPLPSAVDGTLHWLGYINLTLLAFNMLPAFPLDGGRVLRSVLWRAKGDFRTATRVAAGIGAAFGRILIGFGVLVAIAGGGVGALWLALIGWFILAAAEPEEGDARAHAALTGVRVRDAMTRDPVTVSPQTSVRDFVEHVVLVSRHAAYPVVDAGDAAGLVSFRAATRAPRERWGELAVADEMTPLEHCLVLAPDDPLADGLAEFRTRRDRRALVVDRERLVGLLTAADALRLEELGELAARRETAPLREAA